MSASSAPRARRPNLPRFDGDWITIVINVPTDLIREVCIRFEAYDNLAVVRTHVVGSGVLYVYAWEGASKDVEAVLLGLSSEMPIERVATHKGMYGVEELWNS